MKIDLRITNGLAWAGVALVIGVPTADLLSAQFSGDAAPVRQQVAVVSEVAPTPAPLSQRPPAAVAKPATEVAAVAPARPVADPVSKPAPQATAAGSQLPSGKPMPSYITGGGAVTAPAQVAVTQPARPTIVTTPVVTAPAVDPTQVASIPPQKIAPMPMPLSMRPAPITVPVAVTAPSAIVLPPELTQRANPTVTAADLEDWETGPLSEFLASKQAQGGSSATVTTDYDSNGFFLDDGPAPVRRDRVIGWEDQGFSYFAD